MQDILGKQHSGRQTLAMIEGGKGPGGLFMTQEKQVEGKLLSLFFFWIHRGKQKQWETQQVVSE